MTTTSALTITLLILGAVLAATARVLARRRPRHQYTATPLCTRGELAFLAHLQAALEPAHFVAPKVRLIDIAQPTHWTGRNAIIQKHIDFVVVEKTTTRPVAAIELNDKSHNRADRIRSDETKRATLASAGIPLHFVKAAARYDAASLRAMLYPAPPQGSAQVEVASRTRH